MYHKILNHIPKHKFYYELFAGSGAIFFELVYTKKKSPTIYYLNDIDKAVIDKIVYSGSARMSKSNYDALTFLKSIYTSGAGKESFIFLDPPYLHSTRPGNEKLYKYEMTDRQHKIMLSNCLLLECNCMIIHPKCELYDQMLKDWHKVEIKIRYNRKTSIECLYMNYKPGEGPLQTDILLGQDFTDRQRIKRKSDRLLSKLTMIPEQERRYLIDRINMKFK